MRPFTPPRRALRRAGLAAALVAAVSLSAAAQTPQCNTRASVLALLAGKYGEAPVAVGIANGGGLVEVLASPDGESWTIIVTSPQGVSCLVAAGHGWRPMDKPVSDPEA